MARLIPPQPPEGSDNERLVYDILTVCPGTDDWVVLHQLDFSKHVSQAAGEADVVVCVPGEGIGFLEVKGYVELINGQWFFGHNPEPGRSPFKQARGAMFSIMDWLEEEIPGGRMPPMAWGAIFAQSKWDVDIPDASADQLIDSSHVDARRPELLRDAILNLLRASRNRLALLPRPVKFPDYAPSVESIEEFVGLIRPTVHPPMVLVSTIWARVLRFTQEQFAALDECKEAPRVVFKGLAGTGKTVLATEFAISEAQRGQRVLFICYTQLARDIVKSATSSVEGLAVKGIVELSLELIGKAEGIDSARESSKSLSAGSAAFAAVIQRAVRHKDTVEEVDKFDILVIDEGQDVMITELLDILGGWLRGGLSSGRWIMFFDQNQCIYGGKYLSLESLRAKFSDWRLRQLLANCRNTESIAMFANLHGALAEPDAYDRLLVKHRADETHPQPSLRFYADIQEQDRIVLTHLLALIDSGIPPGEIVVISGSKFDSCASRLCASGFGSILVPYQQKHQDKIRYETIHRFKGLESYCVVLTDIDELPKRSSVKPIRELLYTAITRAVFRLDCFANETLRGELSAETNGGPKSQ